MRRSDSWWSWYWPYAVGCAVATVLLIWIVVWCIVRTSENVDACERRGMVYLYRERACVQGFRP